ncbi:MAG: UDP-glucose 4-epimerase GalE [Clostridia bacterium]|nr:UDP-glucose 4-epimerase GalE [Clostridia bacterium]
MKILITGGAGFIGSHTAVCLLEAGHDIVIVDNLSNSKRASIDRIERICGRAVDFCCADVSDRAALDDIFARHQIDAVVHFAGLKAVGESVHKPLEYYRNNIGSTLTLCEAMAAHGCKRLVFSSSATVYGMNNPTPYTEDMPNSATNPYGRTKLMIEEILRDICVSDSEWSIALLRYFNPIGAHPSGLIGEDPQGIPNNLFPFIAQVAVGRREFLNVFGDDYETRDGTGIRDYIHVCDLAEGHLRAIEYIMQHEGVEAFNLGTGNGTSVLELLHCFEEACGSPLPYRIADRRAGDIAESYADCSKARDALGWQARYSIGDMCADGWRFIKNNPSGYPED